MKKQTLKSPLFLSVFIILLFSFLHGWGQESDLDILTTRKEVAKEWLKNTEKEYFCVMLLTAYELYEDDCYADSTDMGWGTYMTTNMGGTYWIPMEPTNTLNDSMGPNHRFDHRVPTFQGFIDFLREYGKGKKSEH